MAVVLSPLNFLCGRSAAEWSRIRKSEHGPRRQLSRSRKLIHTLSLKYLKYWISTDGPLWGLQSRHITQGCAKPWAVCLENLFPPLSFMFTGLLDVQPIFIKQDIYSWKLASKAELEPRIVTRSTITLMLLTWHSVSCCQSTTSRNYDIQAFEEFLLSRSVSRNNTSVLRMWIKHSSSQSKQEAWARWPLCEKGHLEDPLALNVKKGTAVSIM